MPAILFSALKIDAVGESPDPEVRHNLQWVDSKLATWFWASCFIDLSVSDLICIKETLVPTLQPYYKESTQKSCLCLTPCTNSVTNNCGYNCFQSTVAVNPWDSGKQLSPRWGEGGPHMWGHLLKVKCSASNRAGARISIWFLESDGFSPLIWSQWPSVHHCSWVFSTRVIIWTQMWSKVKVKFIHGMRFAKKFIFFKEENDNFACLWEHIVYWFFWYPLKGFPSFRVEKRYSIDEKWGLFILSIRWLAAKKKNKIIDLTEKNPICIGRFRWANY